VGKVALGGAIDLRYHFGPESVVGTPHSVDALGAATDAADLGFAALVLKSNDFPSNAAAYAVQQQVRDVRVLGSGPILPAGTGEPGAAGLRPGRVITLR
jgi:hypothetical protein